MRFVGLAPATNTSTNLSGRAQKDDVHTVHGRKVRFAAHIFCTLFRWRMQGKRALSAAPLAPSPQLLVPSQANSVPPSVGCIDGRYDRRLWFAAALLVWRNR
jgi:hypothetical protein